MAGRSNITTEIFINRSNLIHNNYYDYSKSIFNGTCSKLIITCPKHGDFEQLSQSHLKGKGCIKCGRESKEKKQYLTQEEFLSRANIIHNKYYDYSLVEYKDNKTKIKIICPKHGEFELRPSHHITLNRKGCKFCFSKKRFLITENFIKEANIKHRNKYDYSLTEYIKPNLKIKIICPEHGIFEQIATQHLCGNNCPRCADSKGEKIIYNFLADNNFNFKREKTFDNCKYKRKLKFDFWLSDYNICIEFDGPHHFKIIPYWGEKHFQETIKRDKIKNEYCSKNNIRLIRIKYNQIKNIEEILNQELQ